MKSVTQGYCVKKKKSVSCASVGRTRGKKSSASNVKKRTEKKKNSYEAFLI